MSFINNHVIFSQKPLYNHLRLPTSLPQTIRNNALFNGADIGIPLNLIDNVFTNLHYGYDITTFKVVLLQFLIGYYTYGKDRYKDSIEYFESSTSPNTTITSWVISDKKFLLYESFYKHRYVYQVSYCFVFYIISFILLKDEYWYYNIPPLLALYSTEYYKQLKDTIVGFKPLFVASMWTFSSVILPCLLYDHDYSILQDTSDYLPCFFLLFACTNLADIKDIEEDTMNKIKTIPVAIGKQNTKAIIFSSLFISSYMFGINPHYYDRPLVNGLFEIQNIIISFITYLL
tara:strand:+ start:360 stop:1223 length:864 start_codon:yes stop_codon:yes gene_type:complete